jgi:N-acyl homoserine lactone hydrolase
MSYRVDLPQTGTWIFTVDAADLGENLFDGTPIGSTADPADEPRVLPSLHRLLELAQDLDARIVPGHDPHFWRAVGHPPGGHR